MNPLKRAALSAIGASLLVATIGLAAPAAADKPESAGARSSDHDGDADADASTAYTEDTDTNDGGTANDVADDGDNRHPSGKDRSVEGGSGTQGRSESDPDDDGHGPDRSNGGPDKPNGSGGVDPADQDGNNGCGNDDDFEDDNEGWCGNKPKPDHQARHASTSEETTEHEPCPDGAMSGACGDDEAEAVAAERTHAEDSDEHEAGAAAGSTCPAADADEADDTGAMTAGCEDADVVEAGEAEVAAGAAAAADEDDSDDSNDAEVLGLELTRGGAAGAEVADSTVSAQGARGGVLANLASIPVVGSLVEGELPMTGISTLSFLIVAMAAMVIGFLLVRASRRSEVDATS